MAAAIDTLGARRFDRELVERINQPTVRAAGLPNEAYTSDAFLRLERDQLFAPTWTCLAQACNVPRRGDVLPLDFLGLPLFMVRDEGDEVRVFHNVCSHRGNQLVWEAGHVSKVLRCPYHSWTYGLNGELRGTPHIGGPGRHDNDEFDRSAHGLKPVRSEVWMDLVFVNLSGDAPEFDTHIAPLTERLHRLTAPEQFARMRPAATHGSFELEFDGNWKLVIENNLESYHLPFIHPDLNARSKLEDHYHYYGGDLFAGQGSEKYQPVVGDNAPFERFAEWPERVSEYPTVFPNLFIGAHCDHIWTVVLTPLSPGRTHERIQIYYIEGTADDPGQDEVRATSMAGWRNVFTEDMGVVQGMQRGRHSPVFKGGAFSGVMDEPTHHFHKWVANALSE